MRKIKAAKKIKHGAYRGWEVMVIDATGDGFPGLWWAHAKPAGHAQWVISTEQRSSAQAFAVIHHKIDKILARAGFQKNPVSNTETAVMIVLGAAAVGALLYAFWPKSTAAAPAVTPAPAPTPVPAPVTKPSIPVATNKTVAVGPEANGQTITLNVGDVLIVRLPQQSDTGYVWEFAVTGTSVAPNTSYTEGGTGPGDVQTLVSVFNVMSPGSTFVSAVSRRGGAFGQSFTVAVNVPSTTGIEV
jgi:predicted secreted protein